MGMLFRTAVSIHNAIFDGLQAALQDWFLGLTMRLAWCSALLIYFWNSAYLKVINARSGPQGPLDYLTVEDNALIQMAPKAFEAAGYDASQLGVHYWLMAYGGTYAEFILPLLILIGLFTRLASVGMIGFILVMTWVDLTGHSVDQSTIGAVFDRVQDSAILDQRLLWLLPLVYLTVRGGGLVSLDGLAGRVRS